MTKSTGTIHNGIMGMKRAKVEGIPSVKTDGGAVASPFSSCSRKCSQLRPQPRVGPLGA